MKDRRTHLKVKIKSLADEARIIRSETSKTSDTHLKNSLHAHRVGVVRYEARHSLLAYGFMRNRSYESMEKKCDEPPYWKKVRDIASRFGPVYNWSGDESYPEFQERKKQYEKDLDDWILTAKEYCAVLV